MLPPWLVILVLMELVILGINPSRRDFLWFQSLRRPAWLKFHTWFPLVWLLLYACFYSSSLLAWHASRSWHWMAAFAALLMLMQGYTWLLCRSRRLDTGTIVCLIGWAYALVLAFGLLPVSRSAALWLLPYLLWTPFEAMITWRMRRLNGQ
ncbi:MAG: TspO/MBR family protein [Cyanobacteriota bacterium]|jgi:benzodiazapine receptor